MFFYFALSRKTQLHTDLPTPCRKVRVFFLEGRVLGGDVKDVLLIFNLKFGGRDSQ